MRHSLQSHIIYLEEKVQSLKDRLTMPHLTHDEIQGLEAQLFHAELALGHYRQAYALELGVSGPEPPDGPQSKSGGDGAGTSDGSKTGRRKNGGVAGFTGRARRKSHIGNLRGIAARNGAFIRHR